MPVVSLKEAVFALGTGSPSESVPGTRASGPPGIEAIIEYNGLYLNIRDWIDTFLVTNISGIDDADVRDTRDTNPGAHGETPGHAFYGGRTINLQGKICARTLWKLRDMMQALRAAFGDLDELPLYFHGASTDHSMRIFCRKTQKLEMAEQQTTLNYFERPFSITMRASNPFFTSVNERYLSSETFGTATFDAILFQPVNNGNFPATPRIELTGPMTNAQLLNENNGQLFKLKTGTTIPGGEAWIYSGYRFYRKSDGANRWNYVDPTSTDFTFEPTEFNPIHFTASGLTSASQVQSWNYDTYL